MSVVGIDFGNLNSVLAVARKRGIDVIANEASSRETASLVGFRDDQRTMGEKANSQLTSNLNNTANSFKRLLGQRYNAPETQEELRKIYCPTTETENNTVGYEVDYKGTKVFTPEQITAMLLTQLRKTVEMDAGNKIKLSEAVISVPPFFNYSQRKALQDSAVIAGLNVVQMLPEPLAVAIPWGMYKKDFPESGEALNVMFVNFGESSLWAAVLSISAKKLAVLSVASDPFLGGRDFDDVLATHFAKKIQEDYKMDVTKSKRAMLRLKMQCQKVKKVLTTNPESPIFVESIMNDVDVKSFIKREEFDELCGDLLDRAGKVIQTALDEAQLDKELDVVEVVGGSSYVGSFQERLKAVAKKDLSHTLNKSEAVARGCALKCAIISPQFHLNKVATFRDYNPYTIKLTWTEAVEEGDAVTKSATLFEKGCALNTAKKITFSKHGRIDISADYANAAEFPYSMDNLHIAKFVVSEFKPTVEGTKSPVVKITFKLDESGLFFMQHAQATETFMETVKVKKAPALTKDAASAKEATPPKEGEEAPASPAKDTEGDAKMEEEEEVQKERTKVTNLSVEATFVSGSSAAQLQQLRKDETDMQAADEQIIATLDAKNALEGYSYDAQSKLQYDFSEWTAFASEEEKTKLLAAVDENLAWLYGEGEDANKETFQTKLSALQVLSAPLEMRKNESETRELAMEEFWKTLTQYKGFVASTEEKYAHIESEKRQVVQDKIHETEDWLNKMKEKQEALPKNVDPVLLTSAIQQRISELKRAADPVINTPKPAPPKEEPKEEAKTEGEGAAPKTDAEPDQMDTDEKKEPTPAPEGKIEEEPVESDMPAQTEMDLD